MPIFALSPNELGVHGPGDYIILFDGSPGSETGYQLQQIALDNGEYVEVGDPIFEPALQAALDKMSSGTEVGYYSTTIVEQPVIEQPVNPDPVTGLNVYIFTEADASNINGMQIMQQ